MEVALVKGRSKESVTASRKVAHSIGAVCHRQWSDAFDQ